MLLGLLSKVVPYGRLIGIGIAGLLIAGVGGFIWWQHSTIGAQKATISGLTADVQRVASDNATLTASLKAMKAQQAQADAAVARWQAAAQATHLVTAPIRQRIQAAPRTHAGVAPVLVQLGRDLAQAQGQKP